VDIDERLEQVVVMGAAGKMGRGISWLLAREMARRMRDPARRGRTHRLTLVDVREEGLTDLLGYIEAQATRHAARTIETLRPRYRGRAGVETDEQVVRCFVADVLSVVRTTADGRQARGARLVFEAVPEAERLKIETLRHLNEWCPAETFFLSNTSSIPIQVLDREADLGGRIVGFHFYNPPAVQELVELITARETRPDLIETAREIGRRLGKRLVPARDIAGFIGNGHFMREVLHALQAAADLRDRFDESEAIYALNRVSQEGLVRPMGIFQLVDYVGIDVACSILRVMGRHIPGETFQADLLQRMVSRQLVGGQHADGSQRDGFFRYAGRLAVSIYAPERQEYVSLGTLGRVDRALGPLAEVAWKEVLDDPERGRRLREHFARLASADTLGARLTTAYLRASRRIGRQLVADGVAESPEDVDTVLKSGFHHLYGPFDEIA